ncbi:MAG: hypothetical protein A3G34_13335 [Candidatus Lindowbacteria bacterium RIFCSPLOWO2_12_FULL_62_27]|nr:MAG: hypothetical protein A3I06_04600 [Candidatus Lindowbacteria bacterium RIFCSPLOWO2_02_FULL_62_12]OGH62566.1 MAG: hypothetical protein A3G34_13335 [Candidatus Lindowbacteria bacterium RIFCSPLOWO2_12_FULL_62_27]
MNSYRIPVLDLKKQDRPARPAILRAIRRVLDRQEYVQSAATERFERAFGRWLGVREVVGVNSGTAALYLALKAMGVGQGDEVITTPFSFTATLEAIVHAGARPVLVDIDPATFCISPAGVDRALTRRTKVILPVHLYGHPADMDRLGAMARKGKVQILEDAAQAHGATWNGRKAGTFGRAAAFSFYPSKNLGAYGDAGAVVTDDPDLAERLRKLRNHGRTARYAHDLVGYNERLDGVQAAVLLAKLPFLNRWVRQRRSQAHRYDLALKNLRMILPKVHTKARHAYHLYVIRVRNRDSVAAALRSHGIDSAVHYPVPLHLQPCFKKLGYRRGDFPESELAAQSVLSLPLYPGLPKSHQARVVQVLSKLSESQNL